MTLGLLTSSGVIFAHHGTVAVDLTKLTTVKGTVMDFQYVNPHIEIYFDEKNNEGDVVEWIAEGRAPSVMNRLGWNKKSLKPGDQVTLIGNRSKNGSNNLYLGKVVLASGQELIVNRPEPGSGGTPTY